MCEERSASHYDIYFHINNKLVLNCERVSFFGVVGSANNYIRKELGMCVCVCVILKLICL